MGFVRSATDADEITAILAAPCFGPGGQVSVEFRTDPTACAALLPPPLVPVAIASVGRWHSNVVGPYAGGSISLLARLGDVEAACPIGMWMDSEPAVSFGREVFGEPKKLATARLDHAGDTITATLTRHGVDLVSVRARTRGRCADRHPPAPHVQRAFANRA